MSMSGSEVDHYTADTYTLTELMVRSDYLYFSKFGENWVTNLAFGWWQGISSGVYLMILPLNCNDPLAWNKSFCAFVKLNFLAKIQSHRSVLSGDLEILGHIKFYILVFYRIWLSSGLQYSVSIYWGSQALFTEVNVFLGSDVII